jgi:hypothetical protein
MTLKHYVQQKVSKESNVDVVFRSIRREGHVPVGAPAITAQDAVLFAEMLAREWVERGGGIHPFSPVIRMPSLVGSYTLVTLDP